MLAPACLRCYVASERCASARVMLSDTSPRLIYRRLARARRGQRIAGADGDAYALPTGRHERFSFMPRFRHAPAAATYACIHAAQRAKYDAEADAPA